MFTISNIKLYPYLPVSYHKCATPKKKPLNDCNLLLAASRFTARGSRNFYLGAASRGGGLAIPYLRNLLIAVGVAAVRAMELWRKRY